MIRPGQLDRRITIERPTIVEDPVYGPQPGPWVAVAARVPAEVKDDLPGRSEQVQAGLLMSDRPARVRIRYMRGLSSDMRIVLHGETDVVFQISGGPAEIGRREWTEFTVRNYST